MTIRGAVTTSVLSRKWQHLWKLSFERLRFDDIDILGPHSREIEDPKTIFAKLVNHVMDQYQGSEVIGLDILYRRPGLPSEFGDDVLGRWFSCALTKKVIALNLIIGPIHWSFPSVDNQLSSSSCLKHVLSSFRPVGRNLQIFKSIKSLVLFRADLKPSDFESIFSTCLYLENLILYTMYGVQCVRVVGSSLELKWVEIYNCDLKRIEPNAPELRKLTYKNGLSTETDWKIDTAKLDELNLSLPYRKFENRVNDVFGCYFRKDLFRLQNIVLKVFPHEVQLTTLSILPNLKTLSWRWYVLCCIRMSSESITFVASI